MSPEQLFDLSWQHTTVPQEQLRCPLVATLWLRFLLQELSVLQEVSSQSLLLILSVDSNVWLLRFYLLIRSEIKLLPFLWLTQHWPVDVVAAESIGGLPLVPEFCSSLFESTSAPPYQLPTALNFCNFTELCEIFWTVSLPQSSVFLRSYSVEFEEQFCIHYFSLNLLVSLSSLFLFQLKSWPIWAPRAHHPWRYSRNMEMWYWWTWLVGMMGICWWLEWFI